MLLKNGEKEIYMETAEILQGSARRMFMARVVKLFGKGGQRLAERELGWNRTTIRKGLKELATGRATPKKATTCGRRPIEKILPNLLKDLKETMDLLMQDDPVYQETQFYTSVTVSKVRQQLIDKKGYHPTSLPSNETIRRRLNTLNYRLKKTNSW